MSQNELIALRRKILDDVMPLAIDGVDNTQDKFELLLRIIQSGNAASAVYEHAYEAAKSIENNDDKLSALMSLVDEIDFDLQSQTDAESDQEPKSETPVAPEQPRPAPTPIPVEQEQH